MAPIHNSGFIRALAAVLFLSVCAYAGAGLFGGMDESAEICRIEQYTVRESTALRGIALRWEEALGAAEELYVHSGDKLPAGELIGVLGGEETYSSRPALFYEGRDSLEYLSPAEIEDLDADRLEELLSLELRAEAGARLVYDHIWYFAAFADPARLPREGECCRVLFEGFSGSVDAVASRSFADGEKGLVILRFDRGGEELMSLRKTPAELIYSEYSGLKIPLEALCADSEGNYFVYTLTAGLKEPVEVDIIYWGGDFCLAAMSQKSDGLLPGSAVIVSP